MKKIIILSLISLNTHISLSMNNAVKNADDKCKEAVIIKKVAPGLSFLPAGMGFGRHIKSSLQAGTHPRIAWVKSAMVAAGTYGITYSAFYGSGKFFEFKCSQKASK